MVGIRKAVSVVVLLVFFICLSVWPASAAAVLTASLEWSDTDSGVFTGRICCKDVSAESPLMLLLHASDPSSGSMLGTVVFETVDQKKLNIRNQNSRYMISSNREELSFTGRWTAPEDVAVSEVRITLTFVDSDGTNLGWVGIGKHFSNSYEYSILDDGTAEIICYSGSEDKLVIPDELDGVKITSISDGAFSSLDKLTSVTIPDSVIRVGMNPFYACTNLADIRVSPENPSLAVIDGVLFSKMDRRLVCYPCALAAKNYSVPNGIQIIGAEAFAGCPCERITLPESVTSIGRAAFAGSRMKSILIPHGVTAIENFTFSRCEYLTSVTIPDGVTAIGNCSFWGSNSLTEVILPDSVTDIGFTAFAACTSLKSITIPEHLVSIGEGTFIQCISLASITLPDSVTYIGENAFKDCKSLTITVSRDSYAAQYCKDNSLNYTYTDSLDWLNN